MIHKTAWDSSEPSHFSAKLSNRKTVHSNKQKGGYNLVGESMNHVFTALIYI